MTGLDAVRLRHRTLPERDREAVSLRAQLFGRPVEAPLLGLGRPVVAMLDGPDARGRDGLWRAAELTEELDADLLSIRIDPFKETLRTDGRTDFTGLAEGVAAIVAHVSPVAVMATASDFEDVVLLRDAGVAAIEVSGRHVPLAAALTDARAAAPGLLLIASGGIRHGADVAKALALGATACAVDEGVDVAALIEQLRTAVWLAGAASVHELGREHLALPG